MLDKKILQYHVTCDLINTKEHIFKYYYSDKFQKYYVINFLFTICYKSMNEE